MTKISTIVCSICISAIVVLLSGIISTATWAEETSPAGLLDKYNVVWDQPSKDFSGSMPLGNGDVCLNVWVEENGDLVFYISKSDAWDENARLVKIGRVRVKLTPPLCQPKTPFRQELCLQSGEILIHAGEGENAAVLKVRADANHPAIFVDVESGMPRNVQADLEIWRTKRRELKGEEIWSAFGLHYGSDAIVSDPDAVVETSKDQVVWHHRNTRSIWKKNLELQSLGSWVEKLHDPLLNRTFGAALFGAGLNRKSATTLATAEPRRTCRITVVPYTDQSATPEAWQDSLEEQVRHVEGLDPLTCKEDHLRYWREFWDRSWIFASGDADAEAVTRGYILQRFINACAGRGKMPVKFNGSLFTVDAVVGGQRFDADYRAWGGPYWFQNTRLPYWSMLASGDFDLMQPLFRTYLNSLSLAKDRTKLFFDHDGAFWPETIYFWGTYTNGDYGWDRRGKPINHVQCGPLVYYWQGGLELTAMMLEYFDLTQDETFVCETLLPLAEPIVTFYDKHYPRDAQGRLHFEPAHSLETYVDCVNPMPEIAGLMCVLKGLLALPADCTTSTQREQWQRMLKELPPVPLRESGGQKVLAVAEVVGSTGNAENPELYAIFPYRVYGANKPDLELARRSFAARVHPETGGWQQNAIWAARLGLTEEATRMVTANFSTKNPQSRFSAFWGPNYDWTPDQDHGCVAMIALQSMLLQSDGDKVYLLPAWPKKWDVQFQLYGPKQTTVQGVYRAGKLEKYELRPAGQKLEVVLPTP